jgi:hypothetical protein
MSTRLEPILNFWVPLEIQFIATAPVSSTGILPLLGTVRRLSTNGYTVARAGAGTYDGHGRFVPGVPLNFTIRASIQPLTGRDLLRLPQGLRTEWYIKIITDTPLRTAIAPNGNVADVVTYGGNTFEVEKVFDWSESGGFTVAYAKKQGQ